MEVTAGSIAVGAALLVLGATGATVTQRRLEQEGRASTAPLWLVPFGILIGAGAALVRGFDLVGAIVVGAVVVPVVGAVARRLEVRRHRSRRPRPGGRAGRR